MPGSAQHLSFIARGASTVDPATQLGVHHQFMTQQLGDLSDGLKRAMGYQDKMGGKIDGLIETVNDVALRVAIIEAASLAAQVSLLGARVATLETTAAHSAGERGVWAAIAKSPVVGWVAAAAAAIWLYATKLGEMGPR